MSIGAIDDVRNQKIFTGDKMLTLKLHIIYV